MDVSIIIVNFNTKDLISNCIKSIINHTKDVEYEIIVSDNASTDGSINLIRSLFPQVIVIENNKNLGFGVANNQGLRIAKGKYILYLNSDTILLNNAVKIFFDYWEINSNRHIGALGCVLLDEKGNHTHSGGPLPSYKSILMYHKAIMMNHRRDYLLSLFHLTWLLRISSYIKNYYTSHNIKPGEIGYITGAALFLLNNEDAFFDEFFFLYYEETDLQFRLTEQGLKSLLIDGPQIVHYSPKLNSKSVITSFSMINCQISSVRYVTKNLKIDASLLIQLILKDWSNPAVKKVLQQINIEKMNHLLVSAAKGN